MDEEDVDLADLSRRRAGLEDDVLDEEDVDLLDLSEDEGLLDIAGPSAWVPVCRGGLDEHLLEQEETDLAELLPYPP